MSRIILSRYSDGGSRFVVGWDHPAGGAFWQEFNEEPDDGVFDPDWIEVLREGGMMRGIALNRFKASVPEDVRYLITDDVLELLYDHSVDLDSGYRNAVVDLTR